MSVRAKEDFFPPLGFFSWVRRALILGWDEELPEPGKASLTCKFQFFGTFDYHGASFYPIWTVNLKHFDPNRIDYHPRSGSTEIWEFISDANHPIHVHLITFRVLSRNGKKPSPYDAGRKDTVLVKPGEPVRVVTRFDGYRGRCIVHCHNLGHGDMMMANFEVV